MVLAKVKPQECGKVLSMVRSLHSSHARTVAADVSAEPIEVRGLSFWLQPRFKIGKREVVGHGMNGRFEYVDRKDWPYPAVRWLEPSNESKILQEKEKGDWSKLSIEEKKALYRYSYRITFEEISAPTGDWKGYTAAVLTVLGTVWWIYGGIHKYIVGSRPFQESRTEESQKEQLKAMLLLHVNPVSGIASKWDYEKGKWKNEE